MLKKVEIRKVLSSFVRERITKVIGEKGRASEEEISKAIQAEIVEAQLIDSADLLPVLVDAAVHEEAGRRIRALVNPHEQLGLFAKQQAEEQLVRYEDETVGPMEYARKEQVLKRREDQFKHVRGASLSKRLLGKPLFIVSNPIFSFSCHK